MKIPRERFTVSDPNRNRDFVKKESLKKCADETVKCVPVEALTEILEELDVLRRTLNLPPP